MESKKRAQIYNDNYHRTHCDRIQIQPQKTEQIPARIQKAIDRGIAPSRQAYIIQAIRAALDRDGITLDD